MIIIGKGKNKTDGGFSRTGNVDQILIQKGKKGADVINYFATDPRGKRVNRQMSKPLKGGVGYDKPTGGIYTADMLLKQLKKSYAAAGKPAKSPK